MVEQPPSNPASVTAAAVAVAMSSRGKILQCPYCTYTTPRKDHLSMHVRTHTGEKPYPCPYCPARFVQKGTLGNHIRTHTGEKPFTCPVCSQGFSRNSHLRSHMGTHERELRGGT